MRIVAATPTLKSASRLLGQIGDRNAISHGGSMMKRENVMNGLRIIPAHVHGMLDYPVGILLLLVPNLLGFDDLGGPAVWVPRILGVAIIGMSLLTDYRPGLIRVIPMSLHVGVDIVASLFLALSPFIFGFSDQPSNVWIPHVAAGIAIFLITLLTQPRSETEMARAVRNSP